MLKTYLTNPDNESNSKNHQQYRNSDRKSMGQGIIYIKGGISVIFDFNQTYQDKSQPIVRVCEINTNSLAFNQ